MTNASPAGGPGSTPPFGDLLSEIIKNLRNQPLLLFGLGAAILLLAAGTIVLGDQRTVILAILVVAVVVAVAWVALEALKANRRVKAGRIRTGEAVVDDSARVSDAHLRTGVSGAASSDDIQTGNIRIGRNAQVRRNVTIDTGVTMAGEAPKEPPAERKK